MLLGLFVQCIRLKNVECNLIDARTYLEGMKEHLPCAVLFEIGTTNLVVVFVSLLVGLKHDAFS